MKRAGALALLLASLVGSAGCSSSVQPIGLPLNDRTRWESEWKRYLRFADQKALAAAGDIQGQFVSGIASGKATQEEAVKAALDDCEQRRVDRRLSDECRIHAIGNELVTP